jgi:hypothetical protein
MYRVLAIAAAALLVTAANAAAGNTPSATVDIKLVYQGLSYSCPITIYQSSDSSRKISNNILLNAKSDNCGFYAEGVIATAAERTGGKRARNLAVLSGTSYYLPFPSVMVLLDVDSNGDFMQSGGYVVYDTSNGTDQNYLTSGTYKRE